MKIPLLNVSILPLCFSLLSPRAIAREDYDMLVRESQNPFADEEETFRCSTPGRVVMVRCRCRPDLESSLLDTHRLKGAIRLIVAVVSNDIVGMPVGDAEGSDVLDKSSSSEGEFFSKCSRDTKAMVSSSEE